MKAYESVDTPALLLDLDQVERNIRTLQSAATRAGVHLRPHAKAHKCPDIGRLQVAAGAVGLCCSKLGEAEVMASAGIADMLITTPVIGAVKIARLMALARKAAISVVVDDDRNIAELGLAARTAGVKLNVLVEVDVGQGRCGVPPGPRAAELAHQVLQSEALSFAGLQGYHGAIQQAVGYTERRAAVVTAMSRLETSLKDFRRAGIQVRVITGGGTGTFPIDAELGLLTELQPGSYVTMDANYERVQWSAEQGRTPLGCPLSILASVVSRPSPQRAILDVGWKSASSDGGLPQVKDHPELRFEFAGDEHGALTSSTGELDLAGGDRIELIASHCDTTVNLYDSFVILRAGRPQGTWPIAARGKSQ